jgi:hypothetical protein
MKAGTNLEKVLESGNSQLQPRQDRPKGAMPQAFNRKLIYSVPVVTRSM